MGKIRVLYLDHIGMVDDFVMEIGGGKARKNIEFCFVGKEKEWENQVSQIGERKVKYDVVILHYSFANLDGRELAKKIRLLFPHARLGIKTGVWGYEDRDMVLGALLIESKPDFCFGPYEIDLPFMFSEIEKGRTTTIEEGFRGSMMATPRGYITREIDIRIERE